jgi:hypothetical protein
LSRFPSKTDDRRAQREGKTTSEGSVEAPDHLFELPEFFSAGHTGARYVPPARRTTSASNSSSTGIRQAFRILISRVEVCGQYGCWLAMLV